MRRRFTALVALLAIAQIPFLGLGSTSTVLAASGSISGAITQAGIPLPSTDLGVFAVKTDSWRTFEGSVAGTVATNGTYQVGGLTPGEYHIIVALPSNEGPSPEVYAPGVSTRFDAAKIVVDGSLRPITPGSAVDGHTR